ncbi:MAG: DUF1634 domain-containing protein [Thermoplasmatales archaeon]
MSNVNVRKIIRTFLLISVISGLVFVIIGSILSFMIDWNIYCSLTSILSLARLNSSLLTLASLMNVPKDLPLAIMSIGVMILVFVPIGREILTIFMFLNDDDKMYALISCLVVAIVLISFFVVGPFIHSLK